VDIGFACLPPRPESKGSSMRNNNEQTTNNDSDDKNCTDSKRKHKQPHASINRRDIN
jgi:hypothetical protein